tara:strand:- start:85566 stop:86267 length:702 start_codon:yes stop_codon:yes gene_type:complete
MELILKFKENFLTKTHYKSGLVAALFVIALCTVLSNLYWNHFDFTHYLYANFELVQSGEVWRIFTTSFLHGDIEHLLSNSLMLFILTYFVTSFFGTFYSIVIPFFMGALINYVTLAYYGGETVLVGASGIVYYLWGFWLVMYFFIQRQMSLWTRILRVGAVFLILLVPTKFEPSTSYFAHYFGFALGFVFGLIIYYLKRNYLKSFTRFEYKIKTPVDVDYDYGDPQKDYEKYF